MVCKKCGYQNSLGATFCAGCGSKLTESDEKIHSKQATYQNVLIILAMLVFVVLIFGVLKPADTDDGNMSISNKSYNATLADETALREAIAKHAVTFNSNMAVRNDGMAMFRYGVIEGWSNVASVGEVDPSYEIPIALRWNGTVLTGDNDPVISQWNSIIALYNSYDEILGLRLDGTVVSTKPNSVCNTWTNVESLYTAGSWFGPLALTKDGKVLCADNGLDLSSWSDIVQIGTAMGRVLGLRRDSTVLCADRDGTTIMEGWTDVVSVDGDWDIMALRSDGTILTTATEVYGTPLDFSDWNNLVAIAVDGYTYIGLKNDGTLITNGGFDYLGAVPDFSQWTNLVEFKIHGYNIMGLKADGTVLGYSDSNPNQETFFTDVQLPD